MTTPFEFEALPTLSLMRTYTIHSIAQGLKVRPPAQQARSRRSESALLNSAMTLMAEKEFDRIAVPEIAMGAGLSIGTFYRRFSDKEDFLDALFDRFELSARETFGAPSEIEALPAGARVTEIVLRVCAVYDSHGGLIRALQKRAQDRPELYKRAGRLVTEVGVLLANVARNGRTAPPALSQRADLCARIIFALCDQELAFGMFPPGGRVWSKKAFVAEIAAIVTVALHEVAS
jgi:AcrR family transcriptional regulator